MSTGFRPLQRYEQVAEQLAGDIRSGLLAPGTRLPQVQIAKALSLEEIVINVRTSNF